jgi:hypothetical protein
LWSIRLLTGVAVTEYLWMQASLFYANPLYETTLVRLLLYPKI